MAAAFFRPEFGANQICLPVANVMEHGESDEDLVDKFELVPEEEEANRTIPVPRVERNGNKEWSRNKS